MRQKWSKDLVIAIIRQRSLQGLSIRARDVSIQYRGLYTAALKYIGSWKLAVEVAGFQYADIRKGTEWSRDMVINGIRERVAKGLSISSHAVRCEDHNLSNAARNHCVSWKLAVETAGFSYESVNKYASRKRWSKNRVIAEINERVKKGLSISWSDVRREDHPLEHAGVNYFGNWEAAIEASGHDYNKVIKLWRFKRRVQHCHVAVKR